MLDSRQNVVLTSPENVVLTSPENVGLTSPENVGLASSSENFGFSSSENAGRSSPVNVGCFSSENRGLTFNLSEASVKNVFSSTPLIASSQGVSELTSMSFTVSPGHQEESSAISLSFNDVPTPEWTEEDDLNSDVSKQCCDNNGPQAQAIGLENSLSTKSNLSCSSSMLSSRWYSSREHKTHSALDVGKDKDNGDGEGEKDGGNNTNECSGRELRKATCHSLSGVSSEGIVASHGSTNHSGEEAVRSPGDVHILGLETEDSSCHDQWPSPSTPASYTSSEDDSDEEKLEQCKLRCLRLLFQLLCFPLFIVDLHTVFTSVALQSRVKSKILTKEVSR